MYLRSLLNISVTTAITLVISIAAIAAPLPKQNVILSTPSVNLNNWVERKGDELERYNNVINSYQTTQSMLPNRSLAARRPMTSMGTPTFIGNNIIPVTYNYKVSKWIRYYQGDGRKWFRKWLERSHRYIPQIQKVLEERGLPRDLAYIPMIESGFSAHAKSTAKAVGYWQFIEPTAKRYGLKTNWWLDERRDFKKSTVAAANYLSDLYKMFDSWYLVAAGYNSGENRVMRATVKYSTRDFWRLAELKALPDETINYVPKLIAAMIIAKSPHLYGFRDIQGFEPYDFEYFFVPGGTDLQGLARHLGVNAEALTQLNPELVHGFVPATVINHRIRVPRGSIRRVADFVRAQEGVN
jgi:membrane-bound lytic murein transglycosylase D